MKIQILGSGCPNCQKLEQNAKAAAGQLGIVADFEKITDSDTIVEMGVMRTPALAIDGTVRQSGKVLSVDEVASILREIK
ncbi:MAG TPA: thioredoxin family protein [Spirochaetia bacterium]|nr:thioredoxin family protein [Spirochaetia bacterium]